MADITPNQLTETTSVSSTDLAMVYPTGGPLKKITWLNFVVQLVSDLTPTFLRRDQNLADLNSAGVARTNLGVAYGTSNGTVLEGRDNTIGNNLLVNMSAGTIKGRAGSTGAPQDLTGAQVNAILPAATTSAQGPIEIATNAEVITGTDADKAVVPASLVAAFQSSLGNTGSVTLPGGLIVKWGRATITNTNPSVAVTFGTAFPNGIYWTHAGLYSGSATWVSINDMPSTYNEAASGFNIGRGSTSIDRDYRWLAIGH